MNNTIIEMKNTLEGMNNDSEDGPGPRKKNGGKDQEDTRNV